MKRWAWIFILRQSESMNICVPLKLHLIFKKISWGEGMPPNPLSSIRPRCGPHRTTSIILGKICAQMFPFAKMTLLLLSLYNAILFARKSKYINIKICITVRSKFILIWYLQKQTFFPSLTFNDFCTWNQTTRIQFDELITYNIVLCFRWNQE